MEWDTWSGVRLEFFFFQAEDGIRDVAVTGVQTCALPIYIAQHRATKVRRLHGHLVGSRRHQGKDDASVRNGFFGQVGPYSGRKSNLRSSDGCSLRVGHEDANRTGLRSDLSGSGNREQ